MQRLGLREQGKNVRKLRQRRIRAAVVPRLARQPDGLGHIREKRILVPDGAGARAQRLELHRGNELHGSRGRRRLEKPPAGHRPEEAPLRAVRVRQAAGRRRERGELRICLAVERLIAPLQLLDGAALRLQREPVIEPAEVEIQPCRARRHGLEHVRGGPVGVAGVQGGEIDAVHRLRVAGAQHVFHVQPLLLRRTADGLHEARLAAAGPALDDPQKILRPAAEAGIKRHEAPDGIPAQKILRHRHE